METQWGGEYNEWLQPTFSDICKQICCRVTMSLRSKPPRFNLGFQGGILQSPYYCSISVGQSKTEHERRWSKSNPNTSRQTLWVQCPTFFHSSVNPLSFLSVFLSGHSHTYLQMLSVTAPPSQSHPPHFQLQIPFTTKNWMVGSTFTHRPLLIQPNEQFCDSFRA